MIEKTKALVERIIRHHVIYNGAHKICMYCGAQLAPGVEVKDMAHAQTCAVVAAKDIVADIESPAGEWGLGGLFDDAPVRFSGDGVNPHPGPMTAPFAIWSHGHLKTQVTFSSPSESANGVVVTGVSRYRGD